MASNLTPANNSSINTAHKAELDVDTLAGNGLPFYSDRAEVNYFDVLSPEVEEWRLNLINTTTKECNLRLCSSEIKIHGLGVCDFKIKGQLKNQLGYLLQRRNYDITQLGIKSIFVASKGSYGETIIGRESKGFTSDKDGRVVIFKEALTTSKDIALTSYALLDAAEVALENAQDVGDRTMTVANNLCLNEEMPMFEDRPLIMHAELNKDTNFRGVYIRKCVGIKRLTPQAAFDSNIPYINVAADGINNHILSATNDRFLKTLATNIGNQSEIQVLQAALDFVRKNMPYNRGADTKAVKFCKTLMARDSTNSQVDWCVPFYIYIYKSSKSTECVGGVCSHMAIATGLLLTAAKTKGLLTGSISFDRITEGENVAHAGVRYTESNLRQAHIIDPAQHSLVHKLGSPQTNLFLRNSDKERIKKNPRLFYY